MFPVVVFYFTLLRKKLLPSYIKGNEVCIILLLDGIVDDCFVISVCNMLLSKDLRDSNCISFIDVEPPQLFLLLAFLEFYF